MLDKIKKMISGKKEESTIGLEYSDENQTQIPPQPQQKTSRFLSILKGLNKPMGPAMGFNTNPKRTPMERQLGIPEYISPNERRPDFTPKLKQVPKAKKVITDWRPTPGKQNKKGNVW